MAAWIENVLAFCSDSCQHAAMSENPQNNRTAKMTGLQYEALCRHVINGQLTMDN
jgi:hypothetical protein